MISCYDGIGLFTHTCTCQFVFTHLLVQDRADVVILSLGEGLGCDNWECVFT